MKIDIPIVRFDYLNGNDHYYVTQSVTMDWYGYSLVSFEDAEQQLVKGLPKLSEAYFDDELRIISNLNTHLSPDIAHLEYQLDEDGFGEKVIIPYMIFHHEGHSFVQFLLFFKMKMFYLGQDIEANGHDYLEDIIKQKLQRFLKKKLYDESGNFAPESVKNKNLLSELKGDYKVLTYEINQLVFDFSKREKTTKFTKEEVSIDLFGTGQVLDGAEELKKVAYLINDDYPNNLNPYFGHAGFVEQTYNLLEDEDNNSFLIKGPFGSGKHALVHQCVYIQEKAGGGTEQHKGFEVWEVDPHALIAGMSVVGQWENRIESILQHIIKHNEESSKKIILQFTNVVALIQGGKSQENTLSFSKVLHEYIRRKQIKIIVLCTEEEWAIANEKDSDFMNLLLPIALPDITLEDCLEWSINFKRWAENKYHCAFHPLALQELVQYVKNHASHEALPGALFNRISSLAQKFKYNLVTRDDALQFLIQSNAGGQFGNSIHPGSFRIQLNQSLIGQEHAVNTLSNAYQLIRAGFTNTQKPLGSFLFIGPTGVGKTQAAKLLARLIHGSEDKLLRIDLNEYVGMDSVARLIGSPYYGEGTLTRMVRNNSHGVLLLDEVEKANKHVINLLLQVLDDARLTDYKGKVISFSNLIIIMSSNLGAKEASSMMGFTKSKSEMEGVYRKAVYNFFKPEFINRIGEVVIFNSLNFNNILQIAKLQMTELLSREGFVRRNLLLSVEDKALRWVAQRGYDDLMGGRGLKRQIEKDITALSALELSRIEKQYSTLLRVFLDDNKLNVNIIPFKFKKPTQGLGAYALKTPIDTDQIDELIQQYERLDTQLRNDRSEYKFADTVTSQESNPVLLTFYELQNKLLDSSEQLKNSYLHQQQHQLNYPLKVKQAKMQFTAKENIENQITSLISHQNEDWIYPNAGNAIEFHQLNIKCLKYQAEAFSQGEFDHFFIEIQRVQFDQSNTALAFLLRFYQDFMTHLGSHVVLHEEKNIIEVQGFGLFDLMSKEIGLHLYFDGPGKMSFYNINIFQSVTDEPDITAIDYEIKPEIVRIYIANQMIYDLQQNLIYPIELSVQDFLFLNQNSLDDIMQEKSTLNHFSEE